MAEQEHTRIPGWGVDGDSKRRVAYGMPEHLARHVLLLLLADRVDVVESRLSGRPAKALGVALGLVGGGWLLGRLRA